MVRTVILVVAFLSMSCAAGRFQEAPVYYYGTYLAKCDYQKYSVCCNYNSSDTGCVARLCASMWWGSGWKTVYERCPGDDPQHKTLETDFEL